MARIITYKVVQSKVLPNYYYSDEGQTLCSATIFI